MTTAVHKNMNNKATIKHCNTGGWNLLYMGITLWFETKAEALEVARENGIA